MRCAVWFTQLGFPDNSFSYPYTARSPVTNKKIVFENDKQVEGEIQTVLNQKSIIKFGIGQTLYYEMPFFCNPKDHIKRWVWDILEDYKLCTTYHIPIGDDFDSTSALRIDCFGIIEQEINKVTKHKSDG